MTPGNVKQPALRGEALLKSMQRNGEVPKRPLLVCPEEPNPEVVLTEDLAPVILKMLNEDRKLRAEATTGGHGTTGPIGLLHILETMHGIPSRSIFRITKRESVSVGLHLADKILVALGMNINDETLGIHVYRNSEVRAATLQQTEMMAAISRSKGEFVPPMTDRAARRAWPDKYRRIMLAAQAAQEEETAA